jgi:hypothetical protein
VLQLAVRGQFPPVLMVGYARTNDAVTKGVLGTPRRSISCYNTNSSASRVLAPRNHGSDLIISRVSRLPVFSFLLQYFKANCTISRHAGGSYFAGMPCSALLIRLSNLGFTTTIQLHWS